MNLKQKLAELLSPMGAGNNAYELGQLAQRQALLIEGLVARIKPFDFGDGTKMYYADKIDVALDMAKEAGYE